MIVKDKIKELFRKWNFCRNRKDPLRRYFTDVSNQYNLAPVYIERKDKDGKPNPKYGPIEDIANKLGDENVRNIALTGPYGSGKSSVLRTLMRDYPKAKYLSISLATLQDDTLYKDFIDEDNEEQQKRGKGKFSEKKDEINHLIEYSILQQIIYKEKASKLRQSRLKRIQDIRLTKALFFAGLIVLAVIAAIVLFEPKFLMVESLRSIFSCSIVWKKVWDFVCVFYLVGISIFFIGKIFVATYNSKVNKLNFKDGEISIAENTSVFNKHLDEIIYFFEVTKYNVVIIEDLDRFETTHIFLKLRELNQLLNSSNSVGRRIVFIYAVRDDIFNDTNRTKFFDYITTVIPVINYSNAKDMLLNALQQHGVTDISESTCKELGLYIDDMRMLYNIVDEYIQYSTKLGNSLVAKNLLGMIVYKNYFPDDFSALHNRGGVVYKVISNKKKYQDEVLEALRQKKKEFEDNYISEKNKYQLTTGKELRALYVNMYMLQTGYKIMNFVSENEKCTPQDLIEDEKKFQKLMNNSFNNYETQYPQQYSGTRVTKRFPLGITFDQIEKLVDSQHGYLQRLNFNTEIIQKLLNNIEKIGEEISTHQQKSLAQLLSSFDIKLFQEDISKIEDTDRLVEFLLKKGYINEYYYDYISYFYPATLTMDDKEFLTDLRVGRKKGYTYQLVKIDSVLEELTDELYNKAGILNVSLVKYIADHVASSDEMSSKLDRIIKCIVKYKEKDFVHAFYSEYEDCGIVFTRLFQKWKTFYKDVITRNESNDEEQDTLFEVLLRYAKLEDVSKDNLDFNKQICNSFGLINDALDKIGSKKIETYIHNKNLKFKDLISKSHNPRFMNLIISGRHFERNKQNILSVVSFLNPKMVQSYNTASVTTLRMLGNKTLIDDMNNNLQEYIGCFPEDSVEESVESLLFIVNNCQSNGVVAAYLDKQINKINKIDEITDNEKKKLALKTNLVEPTWENIDGFIKADVENINAKELVVFISNNIDDISKNDVPAEMAKLICRFVQEGSLKNLGVSRIIRFIIRMDDIEEKIRTFIWLTKKENVDDEMVKIFLKALGVGYQEIAAQKGLRPKLVINDYNMELLQLLERTNFISSYKEQDYQYQVNTKKN